VTRKMLAAEWKLFQSWSWGCDDNLLLVMLLEFF